MDRKKESKIVLENSLRWVNNILAEVLSNHANQFPEASKELRQAVSLIEDAKWKIHMESLKE